MAAAFQRAGNALDAAIDAQRRLQAEPWPEPVALRVRMALHTGETQERDGNYFGQPVNRAARLLGAAQGGQIVVSGATADVMGHHPQAELVDIGEHMLRGVPRTMRLCLVTAPGLGDTDGDRRSAEFTPITRDVRSNVGRDAVAIATPGSEANSAEVLASVAAQLNDVYASTVRRYRGPPLPPALAAASTSPMIGRSGDIARGRLLLDAVSSGDSGVLVVVGETGIGKTRLAAAIALESAARGFVVLHGHCEEDLRAPHQPMVEALDPWLALCPDVALARFLEHRACELVRLWPQLAGRLSSPLPSDGEPETQRWRLFEAISRLVATIASERPVLFVFDDVQWAEPATMLGLRHLIEARLAGVGVVVTIRSDEPKADTGSVVELFSAIPHVQTSTLSGLDTGEVSDLIASRTGRPASDALTLRLEQDTDGNPFFLIAVLSHLDELALLPQPGAGWVPAEQLEVAGVPEGVRAVVQRRLGRLSIGERQVVVTAAVAGHVFAATIVGAVLGLGLDAAIEALEGAIRGGLIREQGPGTFAFAHSLVRQTAITNMSLTRRARLHWRIAEELERQSPHGSATAAEIAYHYASGAAAGSDIGDSATVARTSLAAGDDALQRVAFDEAATHFRAALVAIERMGPDPDLRYRVLTSLGHTLNALADPESAEPNWAQAADVAAQANDPERLFAAILGYGYVSRVSDDVNFVRLLDHLLDIVGTDDSPVRASALGWRAMPISLAGLSAPAQADPAMADEAVAMARRTGDGDALALTLRSRLLLNAQAPDAWAMLRDADELARLGGAHSEAMRWDHTGESRLLVRALLRLGRRAEAEAHLAKAHQEAERSGLRMASHNALILESALATAEGRFADGKRLAAEAASTAGRRTTQVGLAFNAQILASRMEQGRLEEVISGLRQLDGSEVLLRAWRAMLAGALADTGEHAAALALLEQLVDDETFGYPRDHGWSLTIRHLPEVCRQLGDRRRAATLLPHVRPWTGQLLVVGVGVSIEGASDRSIGHLLATLGQLDEADAAYTAAANMEQSAGFPALTARTRYWHAVALLEREREGRHGRCQCTSRRRHRRDQAAGNGRSHT